MRRWLTLLVLCLCVGCDKEPPPQSDDDGRSKRSRRGESCQRSADCRGRLRCVEQRCVTKKDDGGEQATASVTAIARPLSTAKATTDVAKPGEFGAKHLLVQYKGARAAPITVTRTKEQARARTAAALAKLRRLGADRFGELVSEFSDDVGSARRGGDLGRFRAGQMVPSFQEAVEELQAGELSGVVETPFGFHVILRTR